MKTNGLVRALAALALPLTFSFPCLADGEVSSGSFVTSALSETSAAEPGAAVCDLCSSSSHCCNCCNPGHAHRWFAGTEFVFVDVNAATGGNTTLSFDDVDTAGVDLSLAGRDGVDDVAYAPRVWIGRRIGDRLGVVARYWHLQQDQVSAGIPAPGTTPLPNFATTTDTGRVELYTLDLEGFASINPGKWKLDGTLGARHASFDVDSSLQAFGVVTPGNFVNLSLSNGSAFDGTGVTSALIARRQLGESRAWLFLLGRGSQLWGHSDSFARVVGTVAVPPNNPLVGAATVTRNNADADLTIAEFQVGIELEFPLEYLPATAFFRTAFEYQDWDLEGPPTGGAGFGGTLGDLTTNSFASAGLGEAELHGLAIATGFTW